MASLGRSDRAIDSGLSVEAPADMTEAATEESDEALVRRCAKGDDAAFARILARYRDGVARLVHAQLGARSLSAEDVAQEVFVQLHRSTARFEGRSSFKTWLYALALNVCRGHLRRERRTARPEWAAAEEAAHELSELSLDPLQRLEREERMAMVRRAVAGLAPAHQVVLQLRDWEELSYEEISRVLAVPLGTVRSRLHHARTALGRALDALIER